MPHPIRLRGPWTCRPVVRFVPAASGTFREEPCGEGAVTGSAAALDKVPVPSDWSAQLGGDFRGRVRYERRFQCPTGLAESDRVWLVVEAVRSAARATLNGTPLGEIPAAGARFAIEGMLQPGNLLSIEVTHPLLDAEGRPAPGSDTATCGGLTGEVRLEIEAAM